MIKLTVIIPCYNEERNVRRIPKELIPELNKLKITYEIIAVDDGSTDNTYKELKKLNIRVIRHNTNKGLACTIITGINNAKGQLIVTLDCDFTFHPRLIRKLLNRFKKGDVDAVLGSPTKSKYGKYVPFYRVLASRIGAAIYSIALGKWVTSATPIFRLYKAKDLMELNLNPKESPKGGFGINAEILAKLLMNKKRIAEIPANLTKRKYGSSKLNYTKEILRQSLLALKILYWRIK